VEKIKVHFHTNLDIGRHVSWPEFVCCKPQVGEYVRSSNDLELKIVRITHCSKRDGNYDLTGAFLSIELHN